MKSNDFQITQYSESSILIVFKDKPSENLLYKLVQLKKELLSNYTKVILDINFTFNSFLIVYKSTINNFYNVKEEIVSVINQIKTNNLQAGRKIVLPVCYDESFGIDLNHISKRNNLSVDEIINLHTSTEYLVYFIGFLPGFPYLLNLPHQLYCSRKEKPRHRIKKGAVGIGGTQTGIYPQDSPGGWQIIGNCPIDIFGKYWQDHSLLQPTDYLQFKAVSLDEYEAYKNQVSLGKYRPIIEHYG